MTSPQIKLLSCSQLDEKDQIIQDIELLRKGLYKEIGWHYYVDLTWMITTLQNSGIQPGATILDAGAGNGLLQFLLSFYGYNVISVDFSPRNISLFTKILFPIKTERVEKKFSHVYISHLKDTSGLRNKLMRIGLFIRKGSLSAFSFIKLFRKMHLLHHKPGSILFYQADMRDMSAIADHSIDAVVSVSAIEHMEVETVKNAIKEFHRVLKTDHPMMITTNAAKEETDWYHKPSEGWCFSLKTLSDLFNCYHEYSASFTDFENVLSEYRNSAFLQNRLANFYYLSDKNGMPGGIWNPQYVPAGILALDQ